MADSEPRLDRWIKTVGAVVAPTTVLAAALYYFGYVSSRTQYQYFGIDVDTLGIGPQDFVMRSPPTLFAPLLVIVISVLLLRQLNGWLRRSTSADADARDDSDETVTPKAAPNRAKALRRVRFFVQVIRWAGGIALTAGVVLLLAHGRLRDWAPYDLITPLVLATGAGLVAYSMHIAGFVAPVTDTDSSPTRLTAAPHFGLLLTIILACSFWVLATVAQASGLSRAMDTARHLDALPNVILDTKENLALRDPVMADQPTVLQDSKDQTFHYRYRNLRLLIVGKDRMFLVPSVWSASDSTLVVPLDGSVRVQFQFQNNPP